VQAVAARVSQPLKTEAPETTSSGEERGADYARHIRSRSDRGRRSRRARQRPHHFARAEFRIDVPGLQLEVRVL